MLFATHTKGSSGSDILQVWRISEFISGTLCGTFAMPDSSSPESCKVEIYGDNSPPILNTTSKIPDLRPFHSADRTRVMRLLWFPSGILPHGRREIFVPTSVFKQTFDYTPREPVPYFVWSSQQTRVPHRIPQIDRYERSMYAGRHIHALATSTRTLQLLDCNVARRDSRVGQGERAFPEAGEFVRPTRPNAEAEHNDPRSFSLPYYKMRKEVETSLWHEDGVMMMDEEHLVCTQVSISMMVHLIHILS